MAKMWSRAFAAGSPISSPDQLGVNDGVSDERAADLMRVFSRLGASTPGESPERIEMLRELEQAPQSTVTQFLARVAADPGEYDLARIEALKILESRPIDSMDTRSQVARELRRVLDGDEDDEVRAYAARAMANFIDAPGARASMGRYVLDTEEDEDVRHNAFFALERGGPSPESEPILDRCRSDPAFSQAAERVLRQWGRTV